MKTLIVGCGLYPRKTNYNPVTSETEECVNLDKFPLPGVNVVFDLDAIGSRIWVDEQKHANVNLLPFEDGCFDRIEAEDVLEHVEHFVEVMQELGRVLRIGGTLWVRGPDARYPETAWADPTHRRLFAERSFNNFDPATWDGQQYGHYFGSVKFRVTNVVEKNKGLEFTLVKR